MYAVVPSLHTPYDSCMCPKTCATGWIRDWTWEEKIRGYNKKREETRSEKRDERREKV